MHIYIYIYICIAQGLGPRSSAPPEIVDMASSSVATWTRGGVPWSIATWTLREKEEKRLEHKGKVFYIDSLPVCAEQSDSDTESDQLSDFGDSHHAFIEKGPVFELGS